MTTVHQKLKEWKLNKYVPTKKLISLMLELQEEHKEYWVEQLTDAIEKWEESDEALLEADMRNLELSQTYQESIDEEREEAFRQGWNEAIEESERVVLEENGTTKMQRTNNIVNKLKNLLK